MNTGMRRNLDPSSRMASKFGDKQDRNPFYRPKREVQNKSNSILDWTPYKGKFRTNPPPNKERWSTL